MKNYITKENILNLALFLQYILMQIIDLYNITPETPLFKNISLFLLIIGYWINTNSNGK